MPLSDAVKAMSDDPKAPTAPLAEFLAAYAEDDNWWWRIDGGHHQNLFEAAVDAYDEQLAEVERLTKKVMNIDAWVERVAPTYESKWEDPGFRIPLLYQERDEALDRAEKAEAEVERLRAAVWRSGHEDGIREGRVERDELFAEVERLRAFRAAAEEQIVSDDEHIMRAWDEMSSQSKEWWRTDCYLAGHPDDEDCHEHDPSLRLIDAEAEVERLRERVADLPVDPKPQPERCCDSCRWGC